MRHRVKGTTTFGRKKAHRKAMIYNLVASLIRNNRIETTIVKAKEAARIAEKLVTFGKKDTVHARRQAFKILVNHELVKKLFN
ncbi:MAG: 50S ribosomal protein L17, partial [Candidatus Cloacimonetes bacterium]|nr:50S ribosomal protein L17 [Candidatus Cloacimonadota bacterium]